MPNKAIATYLRELRKGHRLTQEKLAQITGVSKRTIERLERSQGDTTATLHEQIVLTLNAIPEDVTYLVTHPEATDEEARELAQRALQHNGVLSLPGANLTMYDRVTEVVGIRVYIRILRETQGITRAALAAEMGISVDKLAKWETGQQSMLPPYALRRAGDYLGVPFVDFERISAVPGRSEMLALRLAEERLTKFHLEHRHLISGVKLQDQVLLGRMRAMEGLMHYMLGLFKRLLPDEADAIERTSALWFQTVGARYEDDA